MNKTYIILLAGGQGSRMKTSVNKVLLQLCGKPVITRSAEAFTDFADEMIIVCRPEEQEPIMKAINQIGFSFPVRYVPGGNTRQASVLNGLLELTAEKEDIILIHDAARCLVNKELVRRVIRSVSAYGTGIPGIPVSSTCKICDSGGFVQFTPDRSMLYEIQTPQGFTAERIIPLSIRASSEHIHFTDDAGILEYYHFPVKIVEGSSENIKLTEPADLDRAKIILKGVESHMRVGMGYDVHRLVPERKLILCGVEIPFETGLLGHSDADVAVHALMDSMLGACGLGDIGRYYPDTDDSYKGISSVFLLRKTGELLASSGFRICNVDITIVAQKPKISPYIPQMVEKISASLSLNPGKINIKATTTERLGFEGRLEGISAYAVCSVAEAEYPGSSFEQ